MRWPTRSRVVGFPYGLPVSRTGAPAPRGDPTAKRVLLWFAIIVGLLVGFWLETLVAALIVAT
jgi:hypothetical protein